MRCLDQRRYVGWGGTPRLTHCCHADLTQVETISQSDAWFGVNTRPRSERSIILIVEDEALIRLGAVQIAEDEGFEVIEAANADEAIEILESRNDIRDHIHGHTHARVHGRAKTCSCRASSMAANQDHCNIGSRVPERARSAGGRSFLSQAICAGTSSSRTSKMGVTWERR